MRLKRLLSATLAAAMVLTSSPVSTFADTTQETVRAESNVLDETQSQSTVENTNEKEVLQVEEKKTEEQKQNLSAQEEKTVENKEETKTEEIESTEKKQEEKVEESIDITTEETQKKEDANTEISITEEEQSLTPETEISKKEEKNKIVDATIEKYILENADTKYGPIEDIELVNLMDGQQTIFPASAVPKGTSIDDVMGEDSKVIDQWMGSYWFTVPVYRLSKNADYYVALINTMKDDKKAVVRDVDFAKNSNNGIVLDECVYDDKTGIAYMPSKYFLEDGSEDVYAIGGVQAQILQGIRNGDVESGAESGYTTVVNADGDVDNNAEAENVYKLETTVQAEPGMKEDKLTVSVNGADVPDELYEYDSKTGTVKVAMSSASISTINVSEEGTSVLEKISETFGAKNVQAADASDMSYVYGKKATKINLNGAQEGDYLTGTLALDMMHTGSEAKSILSDKKLSPNVYSYHTVHGLGYTPEWDEKEGGEYKYAIASLIEAIYKNTTDLKYGKLQKDDDEWWMVLNFLNKAQGSKMQIHGKTGTVNFKSLKYLPLICSHVTSPLGGMGGDINEESTDIGALAIPVDIRARIFEVGSGYAVIGFLAQEHKVGTPDNGQTGTCVIKVPIKPSDTYVRIQKVSSNTVITEGNSNYSLAGAKFDIYDSNGDLVADDVATDAKGQTDAVELNEAGTYYVQEVVAPAGFKLDTTRHAVEVTAANNSEDNAAQVTIADEPVMATNGITITKKNNANVTLAGQTLTYSVTFNAGGTTRSWNVSSNTGIISLASNSPWGNNFPLGTFTFKETAAPKGYEVDPNTYSGTVTQSGNDAVVTITNGGNYNGSTGNTFTVTNEKIQPQGFHKDKPVFAGVSVQKADFDTKKTTPQGDADFKDIQFNIYRVGEGTSYTDENCTTQLNAGDLVATIKTNEKGYAETANNALQVEFDYEIQEVATNGSYLLTDGSRIKVNPLTKEDKNKIKPAVSKNKENEPRKGGVNIYKADSEKKMFKIAQAEEGADDINEYVPQGDATLSGIRFAIVNRSVNPVMVDKIEYENGKVVKVITTNEAGLATSGARTLPYGTYEVYELRADSTIAAGDVYDESSDKYGESEYANNAGNASATNNNYGSMMFTEGHGKFTIREDGEMAGEPEWDEKSIDGGDERVHYANKVARGGFAAYKVDKETMISYALGGATLKGIKFELINRSQNAVYVENEKYPNGHLYPQGAVIDDETTENPYFTTDAYGRVFSSDHYLPYGTYELRESETNKTYMKTSTDPITFEIREDGVIVGKDEDDVIRTKEEAEAAGLVYPNQVVRSDYKFQKKDENGRPMANIPFVIENLTTHEKHYIMTDANGAYNSRTDNSSYSDGQDTSYQNYVPHTMNTNAYDEILSQYDGFEEDGKTEKVIPADVIQQLAEKYDYRVGTWFGLSQDVLEEGNEGTMADPDDALGAFPYGSYTIKELKTEKNANKMRPSYPLFVYQNNYLIPGGTLDNEPITIGTTAIDKNIGKENHKGSSKTNATIIDTIEYSGLDTEGVYKFVTELHYAKELEDGTIVDGGIVTDGDGKEVVLEGERFTPRTRNTDKMKVELKLNSTSLTANGEEMETGRTVVFEYLYQIIKGADDKEIEIPVAVHEDPADEGQTIEYPSIRTTAVGDDTQLHITNATQSVSITDRVYYKGLEPGKQYEVTGTLMDKDTGDEVKGADGKAVQTVEKKTANDEGEGYWDIVFTFDGVPYAGKSVVAFERVTTDGTDVAVHADIEDDDQTVQIPKISTSAIDGQTLNKVGAGVELGTFVDTMTYENLIPGYNYVASGTLVNRKTGEELKDKDGNLVTGETEFTPEEKDGSVEITFDLTNVDENLQGVTLVAMEECALKAGSYPAGEDDNTAILPEEEVTLPEEDVVIAEHKDPEDDAQSVYYPNITTDAKDDMTKDHVGTVTETVSITDVVTMENLVPNKDYKVTGTLMLKGVDGAETTELLDAEGNTFTVETEFTTGEDETTKVIELVFEGIDSRLLEGKTVVAYENLDHINPDIDNWVKVATHEDPEDEDQSVHYPKIRTLAVDSRTKDHSGSIFGKAINAIRGLFGGDAEENELGGIEDTVMYENLIPGVEYTLRGTLMNKDTKEPVTDEEGNPITSELVFTPEEADGEVYLPFDVDTSVLTDQTIVVFEKLFHKNAEYQEGDVDEEGNPVDPEVEVARHEDINDEEQSVHEPDIYTTATDTATGTHTGNAAGKTVVDDEVVLKNLVKGYHYTLTGTLYDQSTGKPFLTKDGNTYTTTVEFVADDEDPSFEAEKVEAADDTNKDTADTTDDAQTSDDTQSTDTEDQQTAGTEEGTSTDEQAQTADENEWEEEILPERINGTVHIRFAVDGEQLAGTTVVAFEDLYHNEVRIATHSDINDEEQSVHYPGIRTNAYDNANDAKETQADGTTVIKDVVTYNNLTPGKTYVMSGQLMSKKTGKAINGATAEQTFKAEKVDGSVTLTFKVDTSALAGDAVVAYEKLYVTGEPKDGEKTEIAHHEDINDADQSVGVIDIRTTATDKKTGTHDGIARKKAVVIDRVNYTGLTVGQKYTVKGELMDKATKKGTGIKAETTFTAKEANGYVDLTFKFNSNKYAGKSLVAFEKLYDKDGKNIANHEDLNDADQTVNIVKISTKLTDKKTGKKTATAGTKTKLVDTVTYTGLTPGKKYTVKGTLMDKSTKKSTGIKATKTFTAKKANGTVKLTFTVDTNKYAGKSLVAFEKLYDANDVKIAVHEDIKDKDQTIKMPGKTTKPATPGTSTPGTSTPGEKTMGNVKTGDTQMPFVFGGIAAIALIAVFVALKKKKAA